MTAAAEATHHHAVFHTLTVADLERLTDDSVAITFDVPDDLRDEYRFTQGQHLTIRCDLGGEGVRRNYSICAPATSGVLRIGVKRIPGGAFSGYAMERLAPGDQLDVMTPSGRFFTEVDPGNAKHYAAIAAGSGITPILSIISTVLEVEPRSTVSLLYGNRSSRTVMFVEEVEDLKNLFPGRFQLLHFLSREAGEVELFNGRLDSRRLHAVLDTLLPVDVVDEWFLCGPYEMVTGARDTLVAAGADPAHVHLELFHTGALPHRSIDDGAGADGTAQVTATLDGRATALAVNRGTETILDAVLTARPDAPFACKGGVCGTCRARVMSGTVEMYQNYALEPADVERGYVLTCQSYPTSDNVTVDYDS